MNDTRFADTLVALSRRRFSFGLPLFAAGVACPKALAAETPAGGKVPIVTHYRTKRVDGIKIFYREAGPRGAPVVLLLHGFPTSSRMFRNLIPLLADKYRVIAPDYPAFGRSSTPSRDAFKYTHAHFSEVIEALLDNLEVRNFAMYVMDFGG